MGRQGADPLRRPRQGRRHQGLSQRRRRCATLPKAARHASWSPTRPARAASSSRASTSRRPSTSRRRSISAFVMDRSRRAHHDRGLGRRRHGDRGNRRASSQIRSSASRSTRRSACSEFQAREVAFGLGVEPDMIGKAMRDHPRLLPRVPRPRRHDGRDQPAGGHQATATSSRSTPRCRSTRTRCSAARRSPSCATRARRTRARPTPATAASPTSGSTAISAASSMAPASPWRRWT